MLAIHVASAAVAAVLAVAAGFKNGLSRFGRDAWLVIITNNNEHSPLVCNYYYPQRKYTLGL